MIKFLTVIVAISVFFSACASAPDVRSHHSKECAELYFSMLKRKQDIIGTQLAIGQMSFWGFVFVPVMGVAGIIAMPILGYKMNDNIRSTKKVWLESDCE